MNSYQEETQIEQALKDLPRIKVSFETQVQEFSSIQKKVSSGKLRTKNSKIVLAIGAAAAVAVLSINIYQHYVQQPNSVSLTSGGNDSKGAYVVAKYPPKAQVFENQKDLSPSDQKKCQLISKIGYAFENIHSLQATYVLKGSQQNATAEIQIVEGKYPVAHETLTLSSGMKYTHITDGTYSLNQINGQKGTISLLPKINTETPPTTPFIQVNADGTKSLNLPGDPSFSQWGSMVTAPLKNLPDGLTQLQNWSIQGEENYLNRKTTIIELNKVTQFNHEAQEGRMKIWIDNDTGIALKQEIYDHADHLAQSNYVTKITLNPLLDVNLFKISKEDLANTTHS